MSKVNYSITFGEKDGVFWRKVILDAFAWYPVAETENVGVLRIDHERFVLQSQAQTDLSDVDDSDPFMKQFLLSKAEQWCEKKKIEQPNATFQIGAGV